jgi:hypothetical protein
MLDPTPDDVIAERAAEQHSPDYVAEPSLGRGPTIPDDVLADEDAADRVLREAALSGTDAQPVDIEEP